MTRTMAFALLGMVSWGLWAVFAEFATRELAPEVAMIVSYLTGVGIAAVYLFSKGVSPQPSTAGIGYALVGGLFSGVGAVSYYAALRSGTAAVATTITALYFVVAAIIGIVFLGESVGTRDLAGIALAVGAVVLIAS